MEPAPAFPIDRMDISDVDAAAAVGDPELTELLRDKMPSIQRTNLAATYTAPDSLSNIDRNYRHWQTQYRAAALNDLAVQHAQAAMARQKINYGFVNSTCDGEIIAVKPSPYGIGYCVLQYCLYCGAHEMSAFAGVCTEPMEWHVDGQGPPTWARREYEEFRCTKNHVFRVPNQPACAPTTPVPAS